MAWGGRQRAMETAQHWDRFAKNQPAEIAMFQILEVQEFPAFNGRRSFLTLRVCSRHRKGDPDRDLPSKRDQRVLTQHKQLWTHGLQSDLELRTILADSEANRAKDGRNVVLSNERAE